MHEGHPQKYWTDGGKYTSDVAVPAPTGKLWELRRGNVVCRWNATCALGCAVHAGMRGSRWDAWFTLGCVVHAGMRGARWDARCKADAHALSSIALRACAQYCHNGMICVLMLCEPRLDEMIESATGGSKH